jgi:hypothetical protein
MKFKYLGTIYVQKWVDLPPKIIFYPAWESGTTHQLLSRIDGY